MSTEDPIEAADELREGLRQAYAESVDALTPHDVLDFAFDYLRAHDGHAEFVRKIREIAERAIKHGGTDLGAMHTISALCDVELAKEMSK